MSPIDFSVLGILISVSLRHPLKASLPMVSTPGSEILSKEEQSAKHVVLIVLRFGGSSILVSFLQPEKTPEAIVSKLAGSSATERFLQSEFVAYIDNQRVASNTVEKCWRCDWRGWKRCRFNVFNAILIQDDNLR